MLPSSKGPPSVIMKNIRWSSYRPRKRPLSTRTKCTTVLKHGCFNGSTDRLIGLICVPCISLWRLSTDFFPTVLISGPVSIWKTLVNPRMPLKHTSVSLGGISADYSIAPISAPCMGDEGRCVCIRRTPTLPTTASNRFEGIVMKSMHWSCYIRVSVSIWTPLTRTSLYGY